jgi:hypothetical protein
MSGKTRTPTPIKNKLLPVEAEHSRRLDRLEAEVFPPPPGGPTLSQGFQQRLDELTGQLKKLQEEIIQISSELPLMNSLERQIAVMRTELLLVKTVRPRRLPGG